MTDATSVESGQPAPGPDAVAGGRQLALDFPLDPVFTFESLVTGPGNRLAVEGLSALLADPKAFGTGLALCGESGVGKTHLLQATLQRLRAEEGGGATAYFDLAALSAELACSPGEEAPGVADEEGPLARFLSEFEGRHLLAVDQLELLTPDPLLQEGVLFLYNRMESAGGHLICAGRASPADLDGLRPDLRSRLMAGPIFRLEPPTDAELPAILAKMARDLQARISPDLLTFLSHRLPRGVPDYARALQALNRASMEQKRALTVPLAKKILGL